MKWFKVLLLTLSSVMGVMSLLTLLDLATQAVPDPLDAAMITARIVILAVLAIILWSLGVKE